MLVGEGEFSGIEQRWARSVPGSKTGMRGSRIQLLRRRNLRAAGLFS